jgi:pyruvate kinase
MLNVGDEVIITDSPEDTAPCRFSTNYDSFIADVVAGDRVFIDDGIIEMTVVSKDLHSLACTVTSPGPLFSHKGINLPDSDVSSPAITERDWQCVDWAIKHQLDFLALSFVRSPEELHELKDYLAKAGSDIKVIAKIEKPQAVKKLEPIIDAADIVLVARGDLGVEMDLAEVPLIQKRITHLCRHFGKPVVVATQMLQSMINAPSPTRAEVSDVANAIMDFTDAVMLSGETAVGHYPIQAAKTIRRIAKITESFLDASVDIRPVIATSHELAITAAIARSVAQIIEDIDAGLVAVWSQTGQAARLLSKARIDVPILAVSSDHRACAQMSLHYGVIPRCRPMPKDIHEFTKTVDNIILERKWLDKGTNIVVVAGTPIGTAGSTNTVMVHAVGE